uniref:(northern house mosquito) hypothetical protein n=1 Tax=Culex pipiens TaxID=7175 RepID=A0A8D8P7B0_CULPI
MIVEPDCRAAAAAMATLPMWPAPGSDDSPLPTTEGSVLTSASPFSTFMNGTRNSIESARGYFSGFVPSASSCRYLVKASRIVVHVDLHCATVYPSPMSAASSCQALSCWSASQYSAVLVSHKLGKL